MADYPLIDVGTLTLNRNVTDYHAQMEQAAFQPNNTVPGTGLSPDKMLLARGFSYADAHRARLGVNYQQIPVNRPKAPVRSYSKDGAMRIDNVSDPVYYPNSFEDAPAADTDDLRRAGRLGLRRRDGAVRLHPPRRGRRLRTGPDPAHRGHGRRRPRALRRHGLGQLWPSCAATRCSGGPSSTGATSTRPSATRSRRPRSSSPTDERPPPRAAEPGRSWARVRRRIDPVPDRRRDRRSCPTTLVAPFRRHRPAGRGRTGRHRASRGHRRHPRVHEDGACGGGRHVGPGRLGGGGARRRRADRRHPGHHDRIGRTRRGRGADRLAPRDHPTSVRPELAELVARVAATTDAGRPAATERRHAGGRRTARENIEDLCDPGSFEEYGGAGHRGAAGPAQPRRPSRQHAGRRVGRRHRPGQRGPVRRRGALRCPLLRLHRPGRHAGPDEPPQEGSPLRPGRAVAPARRALRRRWRRTTRRHRPRRW